MSSCHPCQRGSQRTLIHTHGRLLSRAFRMRSESYLIAVNRAQEFAIRMVFPANTRKENHTFGSANSHIGLDDHPFKYGLAPGPRSGALCDGTGKAWS